MKSLYEIGEKVIVIERTHGESFEWDGTVTEVTDAYIETKHRRNPITHPQWSNYFRAYMDTWTKHYFHPDGILKNIKNKI